MDQAWMSTLRCPACKGSLRLDAVDTPAQGRGTWGTMTCACATYPVIDDIPVLLRDRVNLNSTGIQVTLDEGPEIAELVAAVRGRDPIEALVRLLASPPLPWPLGRIPPVRALSRRQPLATLVDRLGDARIHWLLDRRDDLVAEQLLAAFYLHSIHPGQNYPYFLMRFSQPRQLAFLAMLETVPPGLVLDVGCGLGHHSWQLTMTDHRVIGVDYNFAQLWVARWWVAPDARFVCADVTVPLPFPDGVAEASWFADSVDLVPDPERTIAEMQRCAAPGPVFLARIGVHAPPGLYSTSRPIHEWRAALQQFGTYRLLAEQTLAEGYLDGHLPDYTTDDPDEQLRIARNAFAVLSDDPTLLKDHGALPDPPPHARGRLVVNPIYSPVGGDLRHVRLAMPSDWFTFEDGELTRYHDHQSVLTDAQVAALRRNELTPEVRKLIDRFVVVGVPDRYVRRQRRRLKLRVYQMATAVFPSLVHIPDVGDEPPGLRPFNARSSGPGSTTDGS